MRLRCHVTAQGFGHALLTPLILYAFRELRVSASVWEHGEEWWSIHAEPSFRTFESEHAMDTDRNLYNARLLRQACEQKRTARGEFGGHSDLFVPIVAAGDVVAVLVAGPFFRSRPSAAYILASWRTLSGREGHLADPEFAAYLTANLSTLVLDGPRALSFEKFLGCLARLMAGEGDAAALANAAEALAAELGKVRAAERMGDAVRSMVDDRSQRTWHSVTHAHALGALGLSRVADHVLVGFTVEPKPELDPVEQAVRRDAFQRAVLELSHGFEDVVAGRVGEHGVVFLSAASGTPERKRRKLFDLAERVRAFARRRFGFAMHFGASVTAGSEPLSRSYHAALGAAESAMAQRASLVFAEAGSLRVAVPLRKLRNDLCAGIEERPELAPARFDRYIEALAEHSGHRVDVALGHLEVGFDLILERVAAGGSFDNKSLAALEQALRRATSEARTLAEAFAAYRRAVRDLVSVAERPVPTRQDHRLRVAVDHVRAHFTEPLRLARVARMAGFTANHFSRLFIRREGMPFEQYVRSLRIERARQLMASTKLSVTRVAELSGFNSVQYFCRVFRTAVGVSPLVYRRNRGKIAGTRRSAAA